MVASILAEKRNFVFVGTLRPIFVSRTNFNKPYNWNIVSFPNSRLTPRKFTIGQVLSFFTFGVEKEQPEFMVFMTSTTP